MMVNPANRKLLFGGIAAICVAGLIGLLTTWTAPAPVRVKLLKQPIKGGDERAWFQFENRHNQPVEVRAQGLEEHHGREWRWSRECPFTEVLGTPGSRLTWTVPARTTNVFFCQMPNTEAAYRLNLVCRVCGANPSYFGDHLRNYLANLVWVSCHQVGPRGRAVPLAKSKVMSRIRGEAWLVTETFWPHAPEQAGGGPGEFTIPAGVNVPDVRNVRFK